MNGTNAIDIITGIVVLWAVINGWRRGIILQLCSLVGIVVSLYLASAYGPRVGALLHFGESWTATGGFLVTALAALLAVALIGRLCRRIFRFAGLSALDILLGILISLIKWLLLLSALYSAFGSLNRTIRFADDDSLARSYTFGPVCRISDAVLPFVREALDNPEWKKWLPETSQNDPA